MVKRRLAALLIAGLIIQPASADAQPRPVAPPESTPAPETPSPPADPAALAAAERLVRLFMPDGAMEQMLGATFSQMEGLDSSLAATLPALEAADPADADPHRAERTRITEEVTRQAMTEMMSSMEPLIRQAMVNFFARRFTIGELGEMTAFFSTPTGTKYARLALTMQQDPAYTEMVAAMLPRIMETSMTLEERVRAATAHLPPPPSAEPDDDGEVSE